MKEQSDKSYLELEVSDFGPIVKARIDLRPLTVFIGASNTGKSYLSILIYALHRHYSGSSWPRNRIRLVDIPMFYSFSAQIFHQNTNKSMVAFLEQLLDAGENQLSDEGIILPELVMEHIHAGFDNQGETLGDEIRRCFGIDLFETLIRKQARGGARVGLRWHDMCEKNPIDNQLEIHSSTSKFKTIIPDDKQIRIRIDKDDDQIKVFRHLALNLIEQYDQEEKKQLQYWWMRFLELTAKYIRPQIVGPLDLPAYYLPADRTGFLHAHNVVIGSLIENAAKGGLRQATSPPLLSGVLADFLEQLISISHTPSRRHKPQHNLSRQIEKTLLGGSVEVGMSEAINYPQFTYKPDGWKNSLSLINASSMVSELAPVVLYLRHMVVPGNVLIVEEPESHLHPRMQVEFTRQLAALVHAGIRVIITTHSEWVLEELANIVGRSEIQNACHDGDEDNLVALRADQVGAWLFKQKKRPKGSVVEEIKLDGDTGQYPTDFDAVSEELYNESVNIFNRSQHIYAK